MEVIPPGSNAMGSAGTRNNNTAIGYNAGYSVEGDKNVFPGYEAGRNETGSNKLYISNDSSTNLLYGDFSTGDLSLGQTQERFLF